MSSTATPWPCSARVRHGDRERHHVTDVRRGVGDRLVERQVGHAGSHGRVGLVVLRLVTVVVARRRIRVGLVRCGDLSAFQVLVRDAVGASTTASNVRTTGVAGVTVKPVQVMVEPARVPPPEMFEIALYPAGHESSTATPVASSGPLLDHGHGEGHRVTNIRGSVRNRLDQLDVGRLRGEAGVGLVIFGLVAVVVVGRRVRVDTGRRRQPRSRSGTRPAAPVGASTVATKLSSSAAGGDRQPGPGDRRSCQGSAVGDRGDVRDTQPARRRSRRLRSHRRGRRSSR